jgi:hypothetical protein
MQIVIVADLIRSSWLETRSPDAAYRGVGGRRSAPRRVASCGLHQQREGQRDQPVLADDEGEWGIKVIRRVPDVRDQPSLDVPLWPRGPRPRRPAQAWGASAAPAVRQTGFQPALNGGSRASKAPKCPFWCPCTAQRPVATIRHTLLCRFLGFWTDEMRAQAAEKGRAGGRKPRHVSALSRGDDRALTPSGGARLRPPARPRYPAGRRAAGRGPAPYSAPAGSSPGSWSDRRPGPAASAGSIRTGRARATIRGDDQEADAPQVARPQSKPWSKAFLITHLAQPTNRVLESLK